MGRIALLETGIRFEEVMTTVSSQHQFQDQDKDLKAYSIDSHTQTAPMTQPRDITHQRLWRRQNRDILHHSPAYSHRVEGEATTPNPAPYEALSRPTSSDSTYALAQSSSRSRPRRSAPPPTFSTHKTVPVQQTCILHGKDAASYQQGSLKWRHADHVLFQIHS